MLAVGFLTPFFWASLVVFIGVQSLIQAVGFFLISSSLNSKLPLKFVIANGVGIVVTSLLAYACGYLGMRWLMYGYFGGALILFWQQWPMLKADCHQLWQGFKRLDRGIIGLSVLGMVAQLIAIMPSGFLDQAGLHFFRLNGWDGMLHLAFSEFMKGHFPPLQPGAAGLLITNYHYLSDLFIGELSRIFGLPVLHVYFHFLPPLIALWMTVAICELIRIWGGSLRVVRWALFFHFFAGNATFVFMLWLHGTWGFNTPAIDHGVIQFFNMPQAFARLVLLVALLLIEVWLETKNKRWAILAVVCLASLFGFKIYFGLFGVLGFGLLLSWLAIQTFVRNIKTHSLIAAVGLTIKEQVFPIFLVGLFAVIGLGIFLPANKQSGGLFYAPLVWPKIMLGQTNLEWNEWWLRRQVYEAYNNRRNLFIMDSLAVGIFLAAIYATRLIGLVPTPQLVRHQKGALVFLLWLPALIFTFLGMNTLQTSGGANVFNFFILALMVGGLWAGFWIDQLSRWQRWLGVLAAIIIVVLSLPRPAQDVALFIKSIVWHEEELLITRPELEALGYLRYNTISSAVIQTHPNNTIDKETPYSSYFSGRVSYFSGRGILNSHNQPTADRVEKLDLLFKPDLNLNVAERMKKLGVDYLYVRKVTPELLWFTPEQAPLEHLKVAYQNQGVVIYQPDAGYYGSRVNNDLTQCAR